MKKTLSCINKFIEQTFKQVNNMHRPLFANLFVAPEGDIYITNTHYVIKFKAFINVFDFSVFIDNTDANKKFYNKTITNFKSIFKQETDAAGERQRYTITRKEFKELLSSNKKAKYFNLHGIYLSVQYLRRFYACNTSITFYHNRKEFYPVLFTGDKFDGVLAPIHKTDNDAQTVIYNAGQGI